MKPWVIGRNGYGSKVNPLQIVNRRRGVMPSGREEDVAMYVVILAFAERRQSVVEGVCLLADHVE